MRLQKRKVNEVYIESKRARKKVIHELADKVMNGDKNIIKNSYLIYPWLTRDMVNGCIRRSNARNQRSVYRCVALANNDNTGNTSNNAMVLHTINNKGGRPKGSTTVSKLDIRKKIELAKNQIAILYTDSRDKNGGSLKRGTYKTIHDSVLNELGITTTCEKVIRL